MDRLGFKCLTLRVSNYTKDGFFAIKLDLKKCLMNHKLSLEHETQLFAVHSFLWADRLNISRDLTNLKHVKKYFICNTINAN